MWKERRNHHIMISKQQPERKNKKRKMGKKVER